MTSRDSNRETRRWRRSFARKTRGANKTRFCARRSFNRAKTLSASRVCASRTRASASDASRSPKRRRFDSRARWTRGGGSSTSIMLWSKLVSETSTLTMRRPPINPKPRSFSRGSGNPRLWARPRARAPRTGNRPNAATPRATPRASPGRCRRRRDARRPSLVHFSLFVRFQPRGSTFHRHTTSVGRAGTHAWARTASPPATGGRARRAARAPGVCGRSRARRGLATLAERVWRNAS
mmetsp:Transcript_8950/g.37899  ORF Transcript_8950/g.37899 Transcript_8950/m.37899 type:complete len:237 (+) Transcript_8950:624-1334(+)